MEGAAGASAGHDHCVSRMVDRRFVLKELERQKFRQFLGEYAALCEVQILPGACFPTISTCSKSRANQTNRRRWRT